MELNFNTVDRVMYGANAIDQVFQKGALIWPPKIEHVHYFRDAYKNPNVEFSVNAGDKIQFYPPPRAQDEYTWADTEAGLFKLDGAGKLVPVTTITHMPPNWGPRPGSLNNTPVGDVVQSLSRVALTVEFDTSGWQPGTYKLLAGMFAEFDPNVVQFTFHVNQSGVPPQMDFQLPDDPWSFKTQTIDVYRGQTILFKYPKAAKGVSNEPTTLGWRHLNFGYVDAANQTCEAAFHVGSGSPQVDVFGESAGYSMNYSLLGAKRENNAQAFNIGFWADKKQDVLVTIRGDATAEFVYVMCYNGNFDTGFQNYTPDHGILYKLHIKDYVKPTAAPVKRPVFTLDPTQALKYHYTDYVGQDMGVWNIPEYRIPHGSNIQVTQPTPQSLGVPVDVAQMYFADSAQVKVGHPLPSDDFSKTGGLQSRYGGLWILPTTVKAGDIIFLNIGIDASYGVPAAKITFT